MGKWVPRLATRAAYPIFHIKFNIEVKYTKYLTLCNIHARTSNMAYWSSG